MTEIQAVLGRIQLKRMNKWHDKRLKNANLIWEVARKCKGLRVPNIYNYIEHAAYKCYVFVEQDYLRNNWTRDLIVEEINLLGVPCYWGTCSEVYLEKSFEKSNLRPKKRLINAKKLGDESLMFLVHPNLTKKEIQKTCDAIKSIMQLATI
jgi:dTDP-4-amino-4,6-dideoxygalactose transaminase